jgi:hypothetical protein
MKGPYQRLKYDLRRLWECPVCRRHERTDGTLTYCFCPCRQKQPGGSPVAMKLVEDGLQRLVPPIVLVHEPLEPVALPPSLVESPLVESPLVESPQVEPPPSEPPPAAST